MARAHTRSAPTLADIRAAGGAIDGPNGGAEYWPVMNDWVNDTGPAASLALRNINRTTDLLLARGYITLTDDGLLHLTPKGQQHA